MTWEVGRSGMSKPTRETESQSGSVLPSGPGRKQKGRDGARALRPSPDCSLACCYAAHARRGPTCARYPIAFVIQVTLTRVVLLTGGMGRTGGRAHGGQSCKEKGHQSSCIAMRRAEFHLKCLPETPPGLLLCVTFQWEDRLIC